MVLRGYMKLKEKEVFKIILNINRNQPWTTHKDDELYTLLFEECETKEELELMLKLITNFSYIDSDTYYRYIKEFTEEITSTYNEKNTQILPTAIDSDSDSSQEIIYKVKSLLPNFGWQSSKVLGRMNRPITKETDKKNIIIIDEFIGSGKTMINRHNKIVLDFARVGIEDYNITLYSIVSTEVGLENIKKSGINVKTKVIIKKGISDFEATENIEKSIQIMKKLEDKLSKKFLGQDMPSLGYGETESLYARENGNTPNNVFPIFWWPEYQNSLERNPILRRAM